MTAPINKLFTNIVFEFVDKICSLRLTTDSCQSLTYQPVSNLSDNSSTLINAQFTFYKQQGQKSLQTYIAGSSNCSTKPLSLLFTKILIAVKEKLQEYCATVYMYSRSGVIQMWILRHSSEHESCYFKKEINHVLTLSSVICKTVLLNAIYIVQARTLKLTLKRGFDRQHLCSC